MMIPKSRDVDEPCMSVCETTVASKSYMLRFPICGRTLHERSNLNSIRRRLQQEWDREQRALRATNSSDRENDEPESDHERLECAEIENG